MFSELKILFLLSTDPSLPRLKEIFRKFFPMPADVKFRNVDQMDQEIGNVYDLIICDFTAKIPDGSDFILRLAAANPSGNLLIFSPDGSVSGVPPGIKIMLYNADSESIFSLLDRKSTRLNSSH